MVALIASTMTAASAFNYATLTSRTVQATIVTDDNAYLALASHDAQYACYVGYTNGKIDVTWDGGTSCGGSAGTGINPGSTYYFHDVLKITNKGTKTITNLWINSTGTEITMQTATTAGSMTTGGSYGNSATASSLATGGTIYVGFKINAATPTELHTGNSPLTKTLTVEARTTT